MSDPLILYVGEKNISSWSMRGWRAAAYMKAVLAHPTVADWLRAARTLPPAATY
ncbi:MAG TPA: hypothetical protein VNL37_02515 [Candidatus Polarisedimenticolia bacterium]|nr:hypothetical protein [Candidatus Polarisedimenticolia bacterium]